MNEIIEEKIDLKEFYKRFLVIGIPLMIQQLVSSSLNFIDNLMIGRLGTDYIASVGFANSVYCILDLIILVAFGIASFSFILVQLLTGNIVALYKLPEDISLLAEKTLRVYGIFVFFKMINWAILIGLFRAGGDTKVAFYLDILPLWLYGVPLAFIGAYFKIPIFILIGLAESCEVIKLIFALWRYKTLRWIKDVTV